MHACQGPSVTGIDPDVLITVAARIVQYPAGRHCTMQLNDQCIYQLTFRLSSWSLILNRILRTPSLKSAEVI